MVRILSPQAAGQRRFCIVLGLVYFFIVCLFPALHNKFHMPSIAMALNTNQPTNDTHRVLQDL